VHNETPQEGVNCPYRNTTAFSLVGWQDATYLYFVMEYIAGGDLMGLLIRLGVFDEHLSRFFVAELVLAIDSVHRMGFIHRDVKPDNVLIDRAGHIKLTDFGLCTGFRWTHDSSCYHRPHGTRYRPHSVASPRLQVQGRYETVCTAKNRRRIKKVKFSHTRYRALGPELIPVYRQSARR